jgi:hypothetical protein
MRTKTVKRNEDNGDILGVVAFGSLVSNIYQIASKKSLEEEHAALKAYAGELKRHYDNMRVREKLVYNENIELRNAYKELQNLNSLLLKELVEAKTKGFALEIFKNPTPLKRTPIRKIAGGTK